MEVDDGSGDGQDRAAVALANVASEACAERRLAEAAGTLLRLHGVLARRYGPDHDVSLIVDLSLGQVERALGARSERPAIEAATPAIPSVSSALEKSLEGLRACSRASLENADPLARIRESTLPTEQGFDAHLAAARSLANRGQPRAAAVAARRALELANEAADEKDRQDAYEALALLLLQTGEPDGAVAAAERADALAIAHDDVVARISMARIFAQARNLERARGILEAVGSEAERDDVAAAELAQARGDLALRLGSPAVAIEQLAIALELHRRRHGERHPSTAAVLQLRGDAFRMAGDLPAARRDYQSALEIRTAALGPSHPETARSMNAIGVLHADVGDWREADHAFATALATLVDELGGVHPEVITVRANRALVAWAGSKSEGAVSDYAVVVDDLARAYGDDHPAVSEARRNLARMEEERGRPDRAEALLTLAVESQERSLGALHPALAATRLARGRFYARTGRVAEAEVELDRAIEVLSAHYGDEHPLVARARMHRSRVASMNGDAEVAWREASEAARVFDLYLGRSFGATPARQRSLLVRDSVAVVGALLSAPAVAPEHAYASLIPQRDAVLRSVAALRASARRESPSSRAALRELEALRAGYVAAILSDSPGAATRARSLAHEIDAQETVVALAQGAARSLEPSEVLHQACSSVPMDASIVEFVAYDRSVFGGRGAPTASYTAFVLRPEMSRDGLRDCRVSRIELGAAAEIEAVAERFGHAMRAQRLDARDELVALGRMLLGPLRSELAGSKRWLVVPDGALWGVPLSVLPDPDAPDRYLAERVTVGTLTSIHELTQIDVQGDASDAPTGALLFGAPDFGKPEKEGGPWVLTSQGPCRLAPFEPLPATRRELSDIESILPGANVVVGGQATKARLRRELGLGPAIVHLATHAYFAGTGGCGGPESADLEAFEDGGGPLAPNPLLLSGIVLAGANASVRLGEGPTEERASGILTAYEASGLDLSRSRLVVLSACDTGTGLHERGQEIRGLRWGFRAAGARSLVTSLWRSNDAVTRSLMKEFYTALRDAEISRDLFRGAEALRRAQLTRIASERRLGLRKPANWANFVFSGVY